MLNNKIKVDIKDSLEEQGYIINNEDEDFLVYNMIDSISFIDLIMSLEEKFNILIPDEYLTYEYLNTVNKIASIIFEQIK